MRGARPVADNGGELLTVAQAAERLGTTIPRLRRLLARPEMEGASRQEAIETKRGTRTSTVVPVPELPRLAKALQMGDAAPGVQKQEQARLRTFSETEVLALQTTLKRTEELLTGKDRELAAKDEIIGLLKEKIARLEQGPTEMARYQEREQARRPAVPDTLPESSVDGAQEREQEQPARVPETPDAPPEVSPEEIPEPPQRSWGARVWAAITGKP